MSEMRRRFGPVSPFEASKTEAAKATEERRSRVEAKLREAGVSSELLLTDEGRATWEELDSSIAEHKGVGPGLEAEVRDFAEAWGRLMQSKMDEAMASERISEIAEESFAEIDDAHSLPRIAQPFAAQLLTDTWAYGGALAEWRESTSLFDRRG